MSSINAYTGHPIKIQTADENYVYVVINSFNGFDKWKSDFLNISKFPNRKIPQPPQPTAPFHRNTYQIPEAIRKGKEDAMKHLVEVPMDANCSVPHDFTGKFGGATVLLKKAPEGTGIIAGGPARSVLELAGIKNIRTKSLGSNNKQNAVLATIEGLKSMKTPEEVARLRGKSVSEILG